MRLEKIKTQGLAHLSYFLSADGEAAVIDPRRDIDIYLDLAREEGSVIKHVFETHRNEDLLSGAPVLKEETGAKVWHGPNPERPIQYAAETREGDTFEIGGALLKVLETPGHTDDSLSYVLYDKSFEEGPVGVFTGDALFIGDVGRTDFYPDRKREVAEDGQLYMFPRETSIVLGGTRRRDVWSLEPDPAETERILYQHARLAARARQVFALQAAV